jgi:hypothetical protein
VADQPAPVVHDQDDAEETTRARRIVTDDEYSTAYDSATAEAHAANIQLPYPVACDIVRSA